MELELVEYVKFLNGKWDMKAPGVGMFMLELSLKCLLNTKFLDLHDEEWSELEIVRMASSLSWSVETESRLIIYVEQPL